MATWVSNLDKIPRRLLENKSRKMLWMYLNRYFNDEALLKENDKANHDSTITKNTFFIQNITIEVNSLYTILISIFLKEQ